MEFYRKSEVCRLGLGGVRHAARVARFAKGLQAQICGFYQTALKSACSATMLMQPLPHIDVVFRSYGYASEGLPPSCCRIRGEVARDAKGLLRRDRIPRQHPREPLQAG